MLVKCLILSCVLLCVVQQPGVSPGPLTELDFWQERSSNLNSIQQQLVGEKVAKVVKVLELARSTYHPAFVRLMEEVRLLVYGAKGCYQSRSSDECKPSA